MNKYNLWIAVVSMAILITLFSLLSLVFNTSEEIKETRKQVTITSQAVASISAQLQQLELIEVEE